MVGRLLVFNVLLRCQLGGKLAHLCFRKLGVTDGKFDAHTVSQESFCKFNIFLFGSFFYCFLVVIKHKVHKPFIHHAKVADNLLDFAVFFDYVEELFGIVKY